MSSYTDKEYDMAIGTDIYIMTDRIERKHKLVIHEPDVVYVIGYIEDKLSASLHLMYYKHRVMKIPTIDALRKINLYKLISHDKIED